MKLLVINHKFHYEMEKLVRIFMPDKKIQVVYEDCDDYNLLTSVTDEIRVEMNFDSFKKTLSAPLCEDNEMQMGRMVYSLFGEYTSFYPKWGVLTGVRPSKLLINTEKQMGREKTEEYFKNDLLVTDEKFSLARTVADFEEKIIATSKPQSMSLYISIPFCPSRCSYCSFVSHSVENDKARNLLPQYVSFLEKEIAETGEIAKKIGVELESIYIGGGTPTTLSAEQLKTVVDAVSNNFDLSTCNEFTVEAGRPDTITEEKLLVLKNSPVDRISINPQTFNNSVLEAVSRRHTAEDTVKIFQLARKLGFNNINMDLIAGLPTDTLEGFKHSLDTAVTLDPENITIHTLAVKRASGIGQSTPEIAVKNATLASKMLDYAYEKLNGKYHPYYMYRQSKSAGSLENVGWAKDGTECIYNIFMMEECHTILSCGGGAVTKLKAPYGNEIERIFNFKYPFEYISGYEEIRNRKKRITEFYSTYSL
ncbi:MAG: coproporphyrinogen dehydrogenase HemZ [Clostridia bacterium]|nr:coproporphyrinogen dehydrogenase HemZ [Clostridia bacterium]